MKKALIVDDVEVTRYSTTTFLRELGIEAQAVATSAAALAVAQQGGLDVIFVDWHIAKESGVELAKTLRQMSAVRNTPIIMFSAIESPQSAGTQTGVASAFLEKPTSMERLRTCLTGLRVI